MIANEMQMPGSRCSVDRSHSSPRRYLLHRTSTHAKGHWWASTAIQRMYMRHIMHVLDPMLIIESAGNLHSFPPRALSQSRLWHPFHLPENLLEHTLHSFNIYEIKMYNFSSGTSGWQTRLDGGAAKSIVGMDWAQLDIVSAVEHKDGMRSPCNAFDYLCLTNL